MIEAGRHGSEQADEELVRLFDLSLDLFVIAGFDGRPKHMNQAFQRTLGYSREELITHLPPRRQPRDRNRGIDRAGGLSQCVCRRHAGRLGCRRRRLATTDRSLRLRRQSLGRRLEDAAPWASTPRTPRWSSSRERSPSKSARRCEASLQSSLRNTVGVQRPEPGSQAAGRVFTRYAEAPAAATDALRERRVPRGRRSRQSPRGRGPAVQM